MALVEAGGWEQAQAVACAMVAAAACDGAQAQRAVQAVGKLAGHLPEGHCALLLAALAAQGVPAPAGAVLLSLLCSAAQRLDAPGLLWQAVVHVSASQHAVLRQAALLLPGLSVPATGLCSSSGSDGQQAVQLVTSAVEAAEASIWELERHLSGYPLPLPEAQHHLTLVGAAFQAANALRRLLAADRGGRGAGAGAAAPACDAAMSLAAAAALEVLAGAVGPGSRVAEAGCAGPMPFVGQGHAAAVGLVAAARLRAAAVELAGASVLINGSSSGGGGRGSTSSSIEGTRPCRWLLGWGFSCFNQEGVLPPAGCLVQPQELAWLAAALFNVGVDLHDAGEYAVAVRPFHDALSAAACCLAQLAASSSGEVSGALLPLRVLLVGRPCSSLGSAAPALVTAVRKQL